MRIPLATNEDPLMDKTHFPGTAYIELELLF